VAVEGGYRNIFLFSQHGRNGLVALVENLPIAHFVLDFCPLFRYCVFAKIQKRRTQP